MSKCDASISLVQSNRVNRLIIIPLSFLRRLDSLKYTSIIALCSIAYLVILVVAHYIKGDTLEERGSVRVFRWSGPVSALAAFPVIVFAYTCHQNVRYLCFDRHIRMSGSQMIDVLHPERDLRQLSFPHYHCDFG